MDGDTSGGMIMQTRSAASMAVLCLGLALFGFTSGSRAQTLIGSPTLALKSGETLEIGSVYWVSHCKSVLKSTPEAEVLDGPPGVVVTIKEQMVLPRYQQCGNRVPGGMLTVTAKDIEDQSYTTLTVRITYKTRDGDRKFSHVFNLSLIP